MGSWPEKAKPRAEADYSWQVLEADFFEGAKEREEKRLVHNVEYHRKSLETLRTGTEKYRNVELWVGLWGKDLARLKAADENYLRTLRSNALNQYTRIVKKALSSGKPVPLEVIRQRPEFQKARDARARYEKGRHTSFSGVSVGIDQRLVETRGIKLKRQDGKPLPSHQREELVKGLDEVEEVLGPLADVMRKSALTVAHTNGKHPFLSRFGGLYVSGEVTISAGVSNLFGKNIPCLTHELGHWMDFEAGRALGVESSEWTSAGKRRVTWSLANGDMHGRKAVDPEGERLVREARGKINNIRTVQSTLKERLNAAASKEDRVRIERVKTSLGPYWRDPAEVWARLVEQYVATKLGRGGFAQDTPQGYQTMAGWWTEKDFAGFMPEIERQIQRRVAIIREGKQVAIAPVPKAAAAKEPEPPRVPGMPWRNKVEDFTDTTRPLEVGERVLVLLPGGGTAGPTVVVRVIRTEPEDHPLGDRVIFMTSTSERGFARRRALRAVPAEAPGSSWG
jgi:hypothetical protein